MEKFRISGMYSYTHELCGEIAHCAWGQVTPLVGRFIIPPSVPNQTCVASDGATVNTCVSACTPPLLSGKLRRHLSIYLLSGSDFPP